MQPVSTVLIKIRPVLRQSREYVKQFRAVFNNLLKCKVEYNGDRPQIDLIPYRLVSININDVGTLNNWLCMYVNTETNKITCVTHGIPTLCAVDILSAYWLDVALVNKPNQVTMYIGGDYDAIRQRYISCLN